MTRSAKRNAETSDSNAAVVARCERVLARYRAALEAGADPALIAEWSRDAHAERERAQAHQARTREYSWDSRRLRSAVTMLGGWRAVLDAAESVDMAAVYRASLLRVIYDPVQAALTVTFNGPQIAAGSHDRDAPH